MDRRVCTIEGCSRVGDRAGICTYHYLKSAPHGSLYYTWATMKSRCLDPNNKDYAKYGGRGIKVSDEWIDSFEQFDYRRYRKPQTYQNQP